MYSNISKDLNIRVVGIFPARMSVVPQNISQEGKGIVSQVSAPVSTTVIAGDISGATSFGAAVLEGFEALIAKARDLGFVTQDPGRPNLTLTLSPDQDPGAPLDALAKAANAFELLAAPLRLRAMVHYGVVFRTDSPQGVSYVGSAIRSTQSALRRAPAAGGFLATAEFAGYAGKQGSLPFRLQPFSEGVALEGLCQLVFGPDASQSGVAASKGAIDAAFGDYAKRRLSEEIGPFANALVDRALRSSAGPDQFAAQLGREIENPAARKKFEDDLMRFSKSRS